MKPRTIALATGTAIALFLGTVFLPVTATATPTDCSGVAVNDGRSTDLADFLTGTPDEDVASLGTGDDQYFAAEAADTVCGDEGADVLAGEAGQDTLFGNDGDDLIAGLAQGDYLNGGLGSDELRGNGGADFLRGGLDDVRDDLYDGPGADTVVGGDEDVWHKCDDNTPDDHDAFSGLTIPDPDC